MFPQDDLFARRSRGWNEAYIAYASYAMKLPELVGSDREYAFIQMGRCASFLAQETGFGQQETAKRLEILTTILEDITPLREISQEKYLAFSLFLRAEIMRIGKAMVPSLEFLQDISAAKRLTESVSFDGGYLLRSLAMVLSFCRTTGIRHPKDAVQFAELARKLPPKLFPPFPDQISGNRFFENDLVLGLAKLSLALIDDQRNEADVGLSVMDAGVARIDKLAKVGKLPRGREPESKQMQARLSFLATAVRSRLGTSNWQQAVNGVLSEYVFFGTAIGPIGV